MKLDILAIGAHPDDVEISCAGTVIKHVEQGYKVGILDLTRGELGTRGSAELRDEEAAEAAKIMGVSVRENLSFRDGFFLNDEAHQLKVIEVVRKYKPDVVLANAPNDRHPDHGKSASLVKDAVFLSGLPKIDTDQEAWRPRAVYHYIQALHIEPSFVVDISDYFDKKMEAILAYKSQFHDPNSSEPETFISDSTFVDLIKSKSVLDGKIAGFKYAEGYIANRYLGVADLLNLQ